MKTAVFITSPEKGKLAPGGAEVRESGVYNNKRKPFLAGEGLMCVRCDFSYRKGAAALRAAALGVYDLFVNGRRVGGARDGETVYDELKPGWTDYTCRVFEDEYDITALCRTGKNTLVAVVSRGWWLGRISFGYYGAENCAFCAEIEENAKITAATGKKGLWRTAYGGRIRAADIRDGEYYDATRPDIAAAPDRYNWSAAAPFDTPCFILPRIGGSVRVRKNLERRPEKAAVRQETEDNGTKDGKIKVIYEKTGALCERTCLEAGQSLTLDFGANMAGRPRIRLRAPRGGVINMYFTEERNSGGAPERGSDGPFGGLYAANDRFAFSRAVYVAAGEDEETYAPAHTLYGFRYMEIKADCAAEIIEAAGEVLQSDIAETGSFECGSPEVNGLFENILRGMRSNYISIPTNCPRREERLGWTGDAQVFSGSACYLADIKSFMRKWLGDCRCSQTAIGEYGPAVPRVWERTEGGAAWADAGIIVPWRLWQMYGDKTVIEEHWDSMEKYMAYLSDKKEPGPSPVYGDWPDCEQTKKEYVSLCFYAYDAFIMARLARVLGKPNREEHYMLQRAALINRFKALYTDKGEITQRTQTACLLPLAFGMLNGQLRTKTIRRLEAGIKENGYKPATGFAGTGILFRTLAGAGLHGLCWSLLLQKDNTVDHDACADAAEWMFADAAGISPGKPGFERILLKPSPDLRTAEEIPEGQEPVTWVKAAYDSVSGRIESSWRRDGGRLTYEFVIPRGTSAQVSLPEWGQTLCLGGKNIGFEKIGGRFIFRLGAGKHTVECGISNIK